MDKNILFSKINKYVSKETDAKNLKLIYNYTKKIYMSGGSLFNDKIFDFYGINLLDIGFKSFYQAVYYCVDNEYKKLIDSHDIEKYSNIIPKNFNNILEQYNINLYIHKFCKNKSSIADIKSSMEDEDNLLQFWKVKYYQDNDTNNFINIFYIYGVYFISIIDNFFIVKNDDKINSIVKLLKTEHAKFYYNVNNIKKEEYITKISYINEYISEIYKDNNILLRDIFFDDKIFQNQLTTTIEKIILLNEKLEEIPNVKEITKMINRFDIQSTFFEKELAKSSSFNLLSLVNQSFTFDEKQTIIDFSSGNNTALCINKTNMCVDKIKNDIKNLRSAFYKSDKTKNKCIVYRGVKDKQYIPTYGIFKNNYFLSTSTSLSVATTFTSAKGFIYRFHLPSDLNYFDVTALSLKPGENEIIFIDGMIFYTFSLENELLFDTFAKNLTVYTVCDLIYIDTILELQYKE